MTSRQPMVEQGGLVRLSCYLAGVALLNLTPVLGPSHLGLRLNPRDAHLIAFTALLVSLPLFYLACRSTLPTPLRALIPRGRMLFATSLTLTACVASLGFDDIVRLPHQLAHAQPRYWNDAAAMTDCATARFVRGDNPYATFSLVDCFAALHMSGTFATPLQAGAFAGRYPRASQVQHRFAQLQHSHALHPREFESYVSYPAGAFLFPAPFVALGGQGLSALYLAFFLLSYLVLLWRAPAPLWPLVVLVGLANLSLWDYVAHGYSEGITLGLLLLAWALRRHPVRSSLLMAAAVASRQDAWLPALFYLLLTWRLCGRSAALRQLAVIAGLFVALNGPFVLQAPTAWLAGLLGPVRDPMYPGGIGLAGLAIQQWLPLWPRSVYTALEVATLVVSVALYARTCRTHWGTAFVLSVVPLVVAWRSLAVYFLLPLPIFCLLPVLEDLQADLSDLRIQSAQPTAFSMESLRITFDGTQQQERCENE